MFSVHEIDTLCLFNGKFGFAEDTHLPSLCVPVKEASVHEQDGAAPLEESARNQGEPEMGPPAEGSPHIELRDPYLNPLEEIVLETGSLPCAKHGYDHLSRDSTCEFCKIFKRLWVACIAILVKSMVGHWGIKPLP